LKAHTLLYHLTLGSRVMIKKKKKLVDKEATMRRRGGGEGRNLNPETMWMRGGRVALTPTAVERIWHR